MARYIGSRLAHELGEEHNTRVDMHGKLCIEYFLSFEELHKTFKESATEYSGKYCSSHTSDSYVRIAHVFDSAHPEWLVGRKIRNETEKVSVCNRTSSKRLC